LEKWEHRFIIAEKHGKGIFGFALPKDISWKVHYVDGKVMKNWREETLYNYLETVGQKGWQVQSMSTHMSMRTGALPVEFLYIILKRKSN